MAPSHILVGATGQGAKILQQSYTRGPWLSWCQQGDWRFRQCSGDDDEDDGAEGDGDGGGGFFFLKSPHFENAHFENAHFENANFENAHFENAHLKNVFFFKKKTSPF